jgi:hypothetical protein
MVPIYLFELFTIVLYRIINKGHRITLNLTIKDTNIYTQQEKLPPQPSNIWANIAPSEIGLLKVRFDG